MKNTLYIPFLLLMAVTYSRVAENYNSNRLFSAHARSPASVEVIDEEECQDLPRLFNPHSVSRSCL